MKPDAQDVSISNQTGRQRYELAVDGDLAAFADYRPRPGGVELVHTEVLPQYAGKGLGQELAQFALDEARAKGLKVVASCAVMAKYIRRHPQYQDLVDGQQGPGSA